MDKFNNTLLFLLIVALTLTLVFISSWADGVLIFDKLPKSINKQIVYQSFTFVLAVVFLMILRISKKTVFQEHFRIGNISAKIEPVPLIGIKPKPHENWLHIGRNFVIVISCVTAIVIYFQLIKGSEITLIRIISVLPFAVVFAISNSFVEESITRLGVVVVLKNSLKDKMIPIVSAVLFGTIHYWGNPGGIIGVLVAGFLGWLLAKSIIETKGFFWAWFIHFLQDVIIFSALLAL